MDDASGSHTWRHELARDNQLRQELDDGTPGKGAAGFIIGAAILLILGIVYLSPSIGGSTTGVASRDTVEASR